MSVPINSLRERECVGIGIGDGLAVVAARRPARQRRDKFERMSIVEAWRWAWVRGVVVKVVGGEKEGGGEKLGFVGFDNFHSFPYFLASLLSFLFPY